MTLSEMQTEFKREARKLGKYEQMSKTELANGYCDAEEAMWAAQEAGDRASEIKYDDLRSQYYAALSLRYWYKLYQWKTNSASLNLSEEEFIEWLQWTFWDAFYYRLWRWEFKAEVKDGHFIKWKLDENGERIPNPYYWKVDNNAPDKIINRCAGSARGYFYQHYNKQKRKAGVQTYSIDSMVDENGDCTLDYAGCIEEAPTMGGVSDIIKSLLVKGEGIEALIVDGIINYDPFKRTKEEVTIPVVDEEGEASEYTYDEVNSQFDKRKLVKHLNAINQEYIINFCKSYDKCSEDAINIFNTLKSLPNSKLYKKIEKTLIEIKSNKKYMTCLLD